MADVSTVKSIGMIKERKLYSSGRVTQDVDVNYLRSNRINKGYPVYLIILSLRIILIPCV
jgi:hypothetical protein